MEKLGAIELEIDDISKAGLKRIVKSLMSGECKEAAREAASDEAEAESEDRANLKEEKTGKSPAPKVTSEDIPKDIRDAVGKDDEEEEEDAEKKD